MWEGPPSGLLSATEEEVKGRGEVQQGGKLGWGGRGWAWGWASIQRPGFSATSGPRFPSPNKRGQKECGEIP